MMGTSPANSGQYQQNQHPETEIHKLIEPVDDEEEYREVLEWVENILRPQAIYNLELANRRHFGEEDKPRSRRNMTYCHEWGVHAGHEHTAEISQDAALLAANCGVPLMRSVNHPDQDPVFAPDGIMFNGRGDSCHDFIYPPTEGARPAAGMRSNRGKCRTECRDYDTLVSAILLAVKHHVGVESFITSTAKPDREGWQAAFELYSRTFPEREIPVLDNWPRSANRRSRVVTPFEIARNLEPTKPSE